MENSITACGTHINAAAAGFGIDGPANVRQMNAAAAADCVHPAANPQGADIAAIGFQLDPLHITGYSDREVAGEAMRALALPIGHNPGGVTLNIGADLVGIEFAASFLFR